MSTELNEISACLASIKKLIDRAKLSHEEIEKYYEILDRSGVDKAPPFSSLKHTIAFAEVRSLDLLCKDVLERTLPDHPQLAENWYVHGYVGKEYPTELLRDLIAKKTILQHAFELIQAKTNVRTDPTMEEEKMIESKIKTVKLFLASSSELKQEREQIELFIGKENKKLITKEIFIDLVLWEDLRLGFHGNRIQDYFNEKMLGCDIVVFLFFKKVGDYTKEEFDVAYQEFKQGNNPRNLYVYFKSEKVDIDEIDEEILKVRKIKDEIEEAEQIYNKFKSNEHLILQLKRQLELIISDNH